MIADEIIKSLPSKVAQAAVRACVKRSTVVRVQNVCDYYYSNPKDRYAFGDFPNIAPPWEHVWFEYRSPSFWHTDSQVAVEEAKNLKFRCEEVEKGVYKISSPIASTSYGCYFEYRMATPGFVALGAKWMLFATCFNVDLGHMLTQFFLIEPDGAFLILPGDDIGANNALHHEVGLKSSMIQTEGNFFLPRILSDDFADRFEAGLPIPDCSIFDVSFLSLAFIHCKNVQTVKNVIPEPLLKKRARNNAAPINKFYTITIEPMKKVLRTEGRDREVGIAQAFRICRGHFKHYEKGKGLFGKHQATYFWPDRLKTPKQPKPTYEVKL